MGTRQERVIRSWSKDEMGALLEAIYPLVFERTPTRTEAELLLAHLWLETGGNVINNNFGNISVAGFYDGEEKFISDTDYWRPPWYVVQPSDAPERYQRLHEAMLAGQAPSAFRSYSLPDAGMQDYLGLLKQRYPEMLSTAAKGDSEAFANALRAGYAPDAGAGTADSLDVLRAEFREAGIFSGLPEKGPRSGLGLGLLALLGVTVAWVGRKRKR